MDPDTLVTFGGAVKAIGNGKVGGYLVLFSTDDSPDLAGDFFTKDTDFGPHRSSVVHYSHGWDGTLKRAVLDDDASLKMDDVGVWVEAQLDLRDEYQRAIYGLAEKGALGWSSGTASHLVERETKGAANWIKRWPLGLDASLTPTPCEPRTQAVPLKSLTAELMLAPLKAAALGDTIGADMACGALDRLVSRLWGCIYGALYNWDGSDSERPPLSQAFDEFRRLALDVIGKLAPDAKSARAAADALRPLVTADKHLAAGLLTGLAFDDHSDAVLTAVKDYTQRAGLLAERRTRDGRPVGEERRAAFKRLSDELAELHAKTRPSSADEQARALQSEILGNALALSELAIPASQG